MAKQQPTSNNRRADMIYCERCGEDYSATYRRCPFCDERPGRRIDEHGYSTRNPLHLAVLVGSLVIILAAAFIVFTKVAPLLTSREPDPVPENTPGVSDPITPEEPGTVTQPETELPGTQEPEVPDVTDPSAVPAKAIVLSREDITLVPGETFSLTAAVTPADTTDPVVWSCDRPELLEVGQDGTIVNKNATGEKVAVNVTVTAGGVSAKCIVRCSSSAVAPQPGNSGTSSPSTSGGASISGKTEAKVVGATSGLNVRSGPGSNYEKIASIENGSTIVILENTGTGWYKIDYGNGKTGYASVDYIQPK